MHNRRTFLGLAASTPLGVLSANAASRAKTPNKRLRAGFVGIGERGSNLLRSFLQLRSEGESIDIAGVCDVYSINRTATENWLRAQGHKLTSTADYRDLLADDSIDVIFVATPDHWHSRICIDALKAGKHVYSEKPMTRTVEEAIDVLHVWRNSQLVMQVGVQCSSLPVWKAANQWMREGRLGKIMQFQTEFFRNSTIGQWRNYTMRKEMTPQSIDWNMFLGVEAGINQEQPFDREKFAQWRRYWAFGSGLYTDLFVHRITSMLLATGLRFPARVVGAGGVFLEYDGRQVPDVGTVVADFQEGVQGLVTATMCSCETPLRQLVRGHHGSIIFGNGEEFSGFDYVPERPQVTLDSSLKKERAEVGAVEDPTKAHVANFLTAVLAQDPSQVNCSPEVGAAAMVFTLLGVKSYREGKVFYFDANSLSVSEADSSWASNWEKRSAVRGKPNHIPGWAGGNQGSELHPPPDTALAGPWIDGIDPAFPAMTK